MPLTFTDADDLDGIDLKLLGRFNRENALAAASAARALGVGEAEIRQGIEAVERIPGRFESVDEGQPFTVLVDYAHTPGALRTALRSARDLAGGRVVCVFGAGGDRDRAKRPLMGKVVAELADVAVVTSDNPRSEDPGAIAAEVVDGLALEVELDRRLAIEHALETARDGDVVLIAGKGHETGQEIAGEKLPFDDREVARDGAAAPEGPRVIAARDTAPRGARDPRCAHRPVHGRPGRLAPDRRRRPVRRGGEGSDFVDDAGARRRRDARPDDAFAALARIARAVRDRSSARVVGITGSMGKTSTKGHPGRTVRALGEHDRRGVELQQRGRRSA